MKFYKKLLLSVFVVAGFQATAQNHVDLRFSNKVSDETAIHTLALSQGTLDVSDDEQSPAQAENPVVVEEAKEFLMTVKGVRRVTYDKATATLSVLSDINVDMKEVIARMNETIEGEEK